MTVATLWPGPYQHEASAAFKRAREAGISSLRSMALAVVASFKDGWIFRGSIAEWVGCSIRTVGRGFEDGRAEGLLRTARAKPKEVPPGAKGPLPCGWSHRWLPGWGLAGKAIGVEVARAKARFLARASVKGKVSGPPAARKRRHWTAEELEAELARRPSKAPPAEPDPPPDRAPPA